MNRKSEGGIALVITMILLVIMSVMAISLTFISRTETWSSMNYRLMSQARDGAESGVNNAANYLMNTYPAPSSPSTTFNTAPYPVQTTGFSSGHDIVLSANSSVTSNYPTSTVQTAFNTDGVGKGSFSAGSATVNYATSAKLLSVQSISTFGGGNATIPVWEITSAGTISSVPSANEQVTAVLERNIVPTFQYAAFATSQDCSALQFGGGGTTNSYLSGAALSGGKPVTAASNGNIGTNGNLATNGNPTTINGTLSTPRTGTGTCSAGNVDAWTASNGTVTGPPGCNGALSCALVELPQNVIYPTPTIPAPGTTALSSNGSCTVTGCGTGGSGTPASKYPSGLHILPAAASQISDLTLTGNKDLYLSAGTYNINSIKEVGNTVLRLEDSTSCALLPVAQQASCVPVDSTHPVILQVTGSAGGTVVDLSGGSVQNPSTTFDPTTFQILYAGTGTISLKGGDNAVGLLYAPNATFSFGGNADWYGAVIGKNMTDMGGTAIHYDRRLKDSAYTVGPYMLSTFTWNKY